MGMHEGIERAALQQKSKDELVDIIMVSRYGASYAQYNKLPLQRCKSCGAERRGKSLVNIAHTIEGNASKDADGHHIGIRAKRTWCLGSWEFVQSDEEECG